MGVFVTAAVGAIALALSSCAAVACSDESAPANFDALQIAQIKPGVGRVYFHEAACDAGAKGLNACRRKAYVQPGDIVLLGDVYDATACATFVDKKGRATSGIIKGNAVQPVPGAEQASKSAFGGWWVREEADIRIDETSDGFAFDGNATYGAKDPGRVARGAVNSGNFSFVFAPSGNRLSVGISGADGAAAVAKAKADPLDCQLDMIALGPYLAVSDNRHCGGNNVSFTGIYRKK